MFGVVERADPLGGAHGPPDDDRVAVAEVGIAAAVDGRRGGVDPDDGRALCGRPAVRRAPLGDVDAQADRPSGGLGEPGDDAAQVGGASDERFEPGGGLCVKRAGAGESEEGAGEEERGESGAESRLSRPEPGRGEGGGEQGDDGEGESGPAAGEESERVAEGERREGHGLLAHRREGAEFLVGLGADAGDGHDLVEAFEGAVVFAVVDDAGCEDFADAREGGEFVGGRGVEIDARLARGKRVEDVAARAGVGDKAGGAAGSGEVYLDSGGWRRSDDEPEGAGEGRENEEGKGYAVDAAPVHAPAPSGRSGGDGGLRDRRRGKEAPRRWG